MFRGVDIEACRRLPGAMYRLVTENAYLLNLMENRAKPTHKSFAAFFDRNSEEQAISLWRYWGSFLMESHPDFCVAALRLRNRLMLQHGFFISGPKQESVVIMVGVPTEIEMRSNSEEAVVFFEKVCAKPDVRRRNVLFLLFVLFSQKKKGSQH